MWSLSWKSRCWAWIAGGAALAVVATIAGGALVLGGVAAQTAPQVDSDQPVDAKPCENLPPPPSPQELAGAQGQFAARLAQALGRSEADVAQALKQTFRNLKLMEVPSGVPGGVSGVAVAGTGEAVAGTADILAPAAARLGVTPQELADAIKGAAPPPVCSGGTGTPGQMTVTSAAGAPSAGGPQTGGTGTPGQMTVAVRLDGATQSAAIAQQLGRGITAAQVQDALGLLKPTNLPPLGELPRLGDPGKGESTFEQQLATALGVTPAQLKAALQTAFPDGQLPAICTPLPAQSAGPAAGGVMCIKMGLQPEEG